MSAKYYYAEHQAAYERIAREGKSEWNDLFNEEGFPNKAFLESALETLDLPTGARVLEYGCGTGTPACFLASKGYRVHAVDLIPTAIDIARQAAARRGLAIDFDVVDICAARFEAFYALVIDGFCLQSIVTDDDRSRLFAAVRSALGRNGHYVISTAMYDPARVYEEESSYDPDTGVVLQNGIPHRRHLRPEALRSELEGHGFRVLVQDGELGGNVICAL